MHIRTRYTSQWKFIGWLLRSMTCIRIKTRTFSAVFFSGRSLDGGSRLIDRPSWCSFLHHHLEQQKFFQRRRGRGDFETITGCHVILFGVCDVTSCTTAAANNPTKGMHEWASVFGLSAWCATTTNSNNLLLCNQKLLLPLFLASGPH